MAILPATGRCSCSHRRIRPLVVLAENHRLVRVAIRLDWIELERRAQQIRRKNGSATTARLVSGVDSPIGRGRQIALMAGFLGMVSTAARRAGHTVRVCAQESRRTTPPGP